MDAIRRGFAVARRSHQSSRLSFRSHSIEVSTVSVLPNGKARKSEQSAALIMAIVDTNRGDRDNRCSTPGPSIVEGSCGGSPGGGVRGHAQLINLVRVGIVRAAAVRYEEVETSFETKISW